jgi:YegS/Rv2252/BmrU family lipid kinase
LNRNIALLSSSKAGKGKAMRVAEWIQQQLLQLEHSFECFSDEWPADLQSYSDVWLVGGDGTLNYFVNKYPGTQIPISIFKGGSGNDFAWKLHGNISIEQEFNIAIRNEPQAVDAGICNGKYFLNGVGIGFDGAVVESMGNKRIINAGHIAYLYTVVKKIFSYKFLHVRIAADHLNWEGDTFMITIANGSRFGGGFLVAPHADFSDQVFDLIILKKIPFLKRFFYLPKVEKGNHLSLAIVQERIKTITVESNDLMIAHADGELMRHKKFEIQILPSHFLIRK